MNIMFFGRLRKPYRSIFDIFHTLKHYNRFIGIACFTSIQRNDGVEIHFADTGDQIYSAVVSAVNIIALSMLFFCNYYPDDTTFDDRVYKFTTSYIGCLGSICRSILSRRIRTFLKALRLIQEVDEIFKSRGIPVNYEACRSWAKTSIIVSLTIIPTALYFLYGDVNISDDVRMFHFINFAFGVALSGATVMMECVYVLVVADTEERRFEDLSVYLGKLKTIRNSKLVEQELQMISIIHMKLCQSWICTSESMGAAVIGQNGMLYIYLCYPLVYFEYVLPRAKNEMAPILILLFYMTYKILNTFRRLKTAANNLKKAIIELNLEKGQSEPVIEKMCTTLLLQMEHVKIELVLGGFFVVDLESLLSGIKGSSVFMMFFLQMTNSHMF